MNAYNTISRYQNNYNSKLISSIDLLKFNFSSSVAYSIALASGTAVSYSSRFLYRPSLSCSSQYTVSSTQSSQYSSSSFSRSFLHIFLLYTILAPLWLTASPSHQALRSLTLRCFRYRPSSSCSSRYTVSSTQSSQYSSSSLSHSFFTFSLIFNYKLLCGLQHRPRIRH